MAPSANPQIGSEYHVGPRQACNENNRCGQVFFGFLLPCTCGWERRVGTHLGREPLGSGGCPGNWLGPTLPGHTFYNTVSLHQMSLGQRATAVLNNRILVTQQHHTKAAASREQRPSTAPPPYDTQGVGRGDGRHTCVTTTLLTSTMTPVGIRSGSST